MNRLTPIEQVRVVLPHWIQHNHGHSKEFGAWAAKVEDASIAQALQDARAALEQAEIHLKRALEAAGGVLEQERHPHEDGDAHHHH